MKKKNKLTSILLTLAMILTLASAFGVTARAEAWNGTDVATEFAGGNGTEGSTLKYRT